MMVHHYVTDADATFGKAVAAGASEAMPLELSFWGDRYGIVAAPDGYWWGVATHVEDVTPDEMAGHYSENDIAEAVRLGIDVLDGLGDDWRPGERAD